MSFYPCAKSNKPLDVSGVDISTIKDFANFHGKAFVRTVTVRTTINLSSYAGYDKLVTDNFFCTVAGGTCNGNTSPKTYTNGGYIYTGGRYTAAGVAYDSTTGVLTVSPANLYSSGSYEKGSASASVNLSTTVYLVK